MNPAPSEAFTDEVGLYRRLRDADPTIFYDLAMTFLGPLTSWLTAHNPAIDPDLCNEAAEDALLSLFRSPLSFNPNRLSLTGFLRLAAQRDLQNILRRERRHHQRRVSWESVELSVKAGKYLGEDDDPSLPLQALEEPEKLVESVPGSVWKDLSKEETLALKLILQKERKTAVFAAACGLTHLPVKEQEKVVKRLKDRLKKRLERAKANDDFPS